MRKFVFSVLLLAATSAFAQLDRTFVSTSGLDTNNCGLTTPCRQFNRAISQTNPTGEVVALDSGGYGAFTVDRAISITAPEGVYAALRMNAGVSPVAAIQVNAPFGAIVHIRNLQIFMGTITSGASVDGVSILSGTLFMDNSR